MILPEIDPQIGSKKGHIFPYSKPYA
jgi:hypothetical protein